MNVLVACEESQRVTIEFRKLGHQAYSCDLLDCSGNHPEWHIKKDVSVLLNGNCIFHTVDGVEHEISGKWDMIIAFPPCTYLTVAGNRWFDYEKYGNKAIQRMLDRNAAIKFFMKIANADCDKIAIENPVGIMSTKWRKPDQIIQPFEYGDAHQKRTCLWLKGLQNLTPTEIVDIPDRVVFKSGKTMAKWLADAAHLPKEQRALVRSKTFPGIAKAMATQWGGVENYYDYTSEDFIQAGIAKECTTCPDFCEQVHKQIKAINNPNWHTVRLATVNSSDFFRLNEKLKLYITVYRELQETLVRLRKCKTESSYYNCIYRYLVKRNNMYAQGKISNAMLEYIEAKLSMQNVESGIWCSVYEKATGYHTSRRYNKNRA